MDERKIAAPSIFQQVRNLRLIRMREFWAQSVSQCDQWMSVALSHNGRVTMICSCIVDSDEWSKGVIMYSLWDWEGATMGSRLGVNECN